MYRKWCIAKVSEFCGLADKYNAIAPIDDYHSFSVLGNKGRGAAAHENSRHRVDLITATFSKPVDGCNCGFVSG